ncbi:leucyl/phenylalanyl-tRNA--protein transferase [Pendulispora brunnea]|uniref:Leucyl/phenylalanyl-tRNA--protein transferase n=1 Tax=Pendulispora brunnea TaxID=2905690 RepID=A0ABZ2K450_9BACT
MRATEPPRTEIVFPDPRETPEPGIVAVGSDFRAGTLLQAYRRGIFPWPHGPHVLWFSPDPRAILPLEHELHWSRSLRRTLRKHPFEVTVDEAFTEVMKSCGSTRDATWITPSLARGYTTLHGLGWAHSVEVWERHGEERELVGGIYGVAIGSLFAGESMFHTRTDASKIAFATLAERLRRNGFTLFDVQVMSDHLASLGCIDVSRNEYLRRLGHALDVDAVF